MGTRRFWTILGVTAAIVVALPGGHWLCAQQLGETVTVEERELRHQLVIRADVFTEEEETITTPIHWGSIVQIAPDGEHVEKDELITEFDVRPLQEGLRSLGLEQDITAATVGRDLAAGTNKQLDLKDQLDELLDKEAFLEAKMARYRALPLVDEVRIDQGRLRVAQLNHDAASKDYEKAQERFARGMISQAQLDDFVKKHQETNALLEYAQDELSYTKLPAPKSQLRTIELELANVRLEIGKVRDEIERNHKLVELQRSSADAKRDLIAHRIQEKEEYLANTKVYAPISGYLMHLQDFKLRFSSAAKFWKGFNYMRIPDMSSLALRGVMPESVRQYYNEGDAVVVRIGAQPTSEFKGTILSFSKLPHDVGDKEQAQFKWGDSGVGYGIKVYDVTIHLDDRPDWLRPGMHTLCELVSSQALIGPTVPIGYAKRQDDAYYISLDGRYTQVEGKMINGYFLLDDEKLIGCRVDLYGQFVQRETTQSESKQNRQVEQAKDDRPGQTETSRDRNRQSNRFTVSGDLIPVKTTSVYVGRVYGWPKVTWLIDDDTNVTEGTEVAHLDKKEVDDEIEKQESRLQELASRKDTLAEQRDLKLKENEFKLAKEKNLLEIAELDLGLTENGRSWRNIFQARMKVKQSGVALTDVTRRLDRAQGSKVTALSPLERRRLGRLKERRQLELEQAEVNLSVLERGATQLERSKARLDYEEQKAKVATLTATAAFEDYQVQQDLRQATLDEEAGTKRMERYERMKANCVLTSPAEGLLQFQKIWNSGVVSKVNVGSTVGERFELMNVADVSQMYISVEIPEQYADRVQKGMQVEVSLSSLGDQTIPGEISEIEFLFESKRRKDADVGLYSSHEALGETVFHTRVLLPPREDSRLKPGAVAEVRFPFETN